MDLTPAFELPIDLEWLNAEKQTLSDHRGRVIALLFWNASSVYSQNALLELSKLQLKFPEMLTAISIHIPKFTAELDNKLIFDAHTRLNAHVLAVNDKNCASWQDYSIESWPTFVLIDCNGMFVDLIIGDMQYKQIESKIADLVLDVSENLSNKSKDMKPNPKNKSFSTLNNPRAILLHNDLIYISDTGNNRILECTIDGHIKRTFGNSLALNMDGIASEAAFNRPVGLCISREHLYVADTGNHAIRRIRLLDGFVDTLLGNGAPGRSDEKVVSDYQDIQFNNPTAISVMQESIVVADSGNNCLWIYNLVNRHFSLLVGSGELGLVDGTGAKAQMAHPLAISGSSNYLYIAEGSSSSIRTVAVPEGRINTLIGHGLFHFGLSDGSKQTASLQYPCDLEIDNKRSLIWIVDSYNRKIRTLDLSNNLLSNSLMTSNFLNPSALTLGEDSVWIADAGSNSIYRYYIETDYLSRITIQA